MYLEMEICDWRLVLGIGIKLDWDGMGIEIRIQIENYIRALGLFDLFWGSWVSKKV